MLNLVFAKRIKMDVVLLGSSSLWRRCHAEPHSQYYFSFCLVFFFFHFFFLFGDANEISCLRLARCLLWRRQPNTRMLFFVRVTPFTFFFRLREPACDDVTSNLMSPTLWKQNNNEKWDDFSIFCAFWKHSFWNRRK